MATDPERKKIREVITREQYRSQMNIGLRILNQSNKIITSLTFIFVLTTRSIAAAYFGLGAIGCVVVVKFCKHIFREARPAGTTYKITYGMPSTHSATISYYATFITLSCLYLPVHSSLSAVPRSLIYPVAPIAATSCAAIVCISRIRLGHHTLKQVGAGILVGVVVGFGWFSWWTSGSGRPFIETIVSILPDWIRSWIR